MYFSISGKLTHVFKNTIVLNVNDVSYSIFVANVNKYIVGNIYTIYLYHVIKEDDEFLMGFSSLEEKKIFLLLISVKGIGPKTAISALNNINKNELLNAIKEENIDYLKTLPGIGNKAARQIILDLKDRLVKPESSSLKEIYGILKNLGFKNSEISDALYGINTNLAKEEILKLTLNRLRK